MPEVSWKGSPNFFTQNGVPKLFITLHWMVGYLRTTDVIFASTHRKASANYGVGQTEIHQYVQEKDYPFSDGNTYANRHTISIEHEGGYLGANGIRVNPSEAVVKLSAILCADIARRHGFGKLVLGRNVFPHQHWVATSCPGTLAMQRICDLANQINENPPAPLKGVNTGYSLPTGWNTSSWSTEHIQSALIRLGYDLGHWGADGNYGAATTKAVRKFEHDQGLSVDVGVAGPQVVGRLAALTDGTNTLTGLPPVAQSNRLVVDGVWGRLTTKALQRTLRVAADGVIGPVTSKALQHHLGVAADGVIGPVTRKALQHHLGVRQDSVWGPVTVRALQSRLNAGTF